MAPVATLAVALALLLDLVVAEPPVSIHPVAWFGRFVGRFDRPFAHPGVVGFLVAAALPVAAAAAVAIPVALLEGVNPLLGGLAAGGVLFTTVSLRMLVTEGAKIVRLSDGATDEAREAALSLVGRDRASLSPAQIRSAAVESVAENLADGLVGPLLAFAIAAQVSLPAAVGAAVWVKAVNTLDSMLGYPDKAVGTASARLDDLVAWAPARLSALLIALAAVNPSALSSARAWARSPGSPNSGWPMATAAAAADVQLEKPGEYVLNPEATLPTVESAGGAIRVVGIAGLLAFALAGVGTWV